MKKIWSAVTVVLLTAVSAGVIVYGSSVSDRKIDTSGKQTYAWPLATCSTEDTITHVFAQTFAEEVERLSGGEMEIQVYSQGTLGGDRELMERDGKDPFRYEPAASICPNTEGNKVIQRCFPRLSQAEILECLKEVGGQAVLGRQAL